MVNPRPSCTATGRGRRPVRYEAPRARWKICARVKLGLTLACVRPHRAWTQTPSRVVVVGGGFGGATCAKYLRRADPSLEVTLVEPHRQFVTCPFSNAVLVGLRDLASVTHTYDGLRQRYGIRL